MNDYISSEPGGTYELAGRTVARVGYGAMMLAGPGGRPAPPREQAIALLRRAVELGVNHIDTAAFYGPGLCNELIREALGSAGGGYPDGLTLVTKVGAAEVDGGIAMAQRPEQLRAQVEDNLRTLGTDHLDVVNLRRGDRLPGLLAEGDQIVDLDSQLATLIELREAGTIGAIGLSHITAPQLAQALPAGIVCVQNAYNVLERGDEDVLALAAERDVAWVPFFPLGSGFPGRPKVTEDPAVLAVAAELDATPSQVGLAWLLHHQAGTLLIPGTTSIAHLEENVAAGAVALHDEALARLDTIAAVS